jgi:hypothetical protein
LQAPLTIHIVYSNPTHDSNLNFAPSNNRQAINYELGTPLPVPRFIFLFSQ